MVNRKFPGFKRPKGFKKKKLERKLAENRK